MLFRRNVCLLHMRMADDLGASRAERKAGPSPQVEGKSSPEEKD